jgi:hypothetical protein
LIGDGISVCKVVVDGRRLALNSVGLVD